MEVASLDIYIFQVPKVEEQMTTDYIPAQSEQVPDFPLLSYNQVLPITHTGPWELQII